MRARPASLKVRALQWLAQREHSPQELRAKLLRLLARSATEPGSGDGRLPAGAMTRETALPPDPEAEVDALITWLTAGAYLSTDRFVESRVNARQSRFGNLRIRHELQQHGLQLDASARLALQSSEAQRAADVWQRKFGRPAVDARQRMQQLRFLAGRGFSADVSRKVVLGAAKLAADLGDPASPDDAGTTPFD